MLTLQVANDVIRERFHYLRPESPITDPVSRGDLAEILGDTHPTFSVVDGVTEGMVLHGLDPLSNKDCATFGQRLPTAISRQGPAVVSLDHVTKSPDGRGRYAIGAVHKLNGLNGGAYLLDNRTPFGIGRKGTSTIKIAKDRPGNCAGTDSHPAAGCTGSVTSSSTRKMRRSPNWQSRHPPTGIRTGDPPS